MFTLAISYLSTSNLPWFTDLIFQVPKQYCSLQTLLPLPVTSTTGWCFCFGSVSSFFLWLFLRWSPVAYLSPTDLESSSFSVLSFCIFILQRWTQKYKSQGLIGRRIQRSIIKVSLSRVSWTARRSNQSILEDQLWVFIGRTDAEAETLVLWPPDVKSWLIGKDPDAGKNWRQEEKGTAENAMVGWHHWLSGHEFEQTLGDSEGQGSLACCSPWGCKELDTTEWLNNNRVSASVTL